MSIILACGAECGIVTAGLPASSTKTHWHSINGAPAIDTGVFRSGAKSFKFVAAATPPRLMKSFTTSSTVGYFRAYYRFSDATPPAETTVFYLESTTSASSAYFTVTTGGVLYAAFNGTTGQQNGPTISDNTWYGIEAEVDIHANPNVIRWRTWDAGGGWVSQTNVSVAQAAAVFNSSGTATFYMGIVSSTPTSGLTVYIDDVLVGAGTTAGADYDTSTSKGGKVLRYLPTADGPASPHPFNNNDFADGAAGSGFANTATDMYTRLDDDDQQSLTDFIRQAVAWSSGTKAFGVDFDTEATETTPRVVAVTSTHHSSGTGANEMNIRVSDDGTNWTNVWGDWAGVGDDVSDTTAHFRHLVLASKPSSGAWTLSAVNAMRAQLGQSNDVSAVPYYDSISLEVEWTESAKSFLYPRRNRHMLIR